MKRHSTVHALYMSFYSSSLYRDVRANWRGIAFLHLFLLLAICWIPIMFKLQSRLNHFINNEAPKIIRQIPEITITDGIVSTREKKPYYIKDADTGETLLLIDTTGEITSIEDYDAVMLLTKTQLIVKRNAIETRSFDLSQVKSFSIDQLTLFRWSEAIQQWLILLLYPFALFFSYFYRLAQALLYAAIGMLLAKIFHAQLRYQELLSLSLIALTPVIIVNTAYNYMDIRVPFWWLLSFTVAMGYLAFAVKANSGGLTADVQRP